MSSRRTLILIAAVLVGAVLAFALWSITGEAVENGNDTPADLSGEYDSECDSQGNRVYITEFEHNIFVVPDDCGDGL